MAKEGYYEPEMGQMAFGCAWGEYDLRDDWIDNRLCELSEDIYETIGPELGDSGFGYGQEFKNDVFETHRYYWGDCTCGYEEKEAGWGKQNRHRESCYQELVKDELERRGWHRDEGGHIESPEGLLWDEERKIQDEVREKYCKQFELPFPQGCAVHCTCDHRERWAEFVSQNNHDPECPIVLPNFRHLPSGMEVRWYKYIGRGMSVNRVIHRDVWKNIFEECQISLKDYKPPRLLAHLRDFFGERGFSLGEDGDRWFVSTSREFPIGVSDSIRDEEEAIAELRPGMEAWLQMLNGFLAPDYQVAWADADKPFWPSYLFPPSCGPEGPSQEYKDKFPDYAAMDERAMEYYEWDDNPDLPPFTDEHWKAVRWAGINTSLILTKKETE